MERNFETVMIEQCAPVLAGLKPAGLFRYETSDCADLARRVRSWNEQLGEKGLCVRVLKGCVRTHRYLVYVYRAAKLQTVLADAAVRGFLAREGYRLPEDAADKTLTWSSSNAAVTVDQTGLIKAVTAGTAVISAASANGKSAACAVTVTAASDFTIEDGVLTAYTGSDTNVAIPEGVTVIGDGSSPIFGSNVESVTIPASVTAITDKAFYNCTGLTTVNLNARGSTIGGWE